MGDEKLLGDNSFQIESRSIVKLYGKNVKRLNMNLIWQFENNFISTANIFKH